MTKKKRPTSVSLSSFDELDAAGIGLGYRPATSEEPIQQKAAPQQRTWGEAIADTGVQLGEGVNTIAGAVPNLLAPHSVVAGFFRDNAEHWRSKQSEAMQRKMADAEQQVAAADQDSIWDQGVAAAKAYGSDPALMARFVTTNLPSMIPGVGAAKAAQAARLAAGGTAAVAAAAGTTAAGVTNATLNAGGARGEAFEDLRETLTKQGYTPEDAERIALQKSLAPAAVGAATGFLSGKTGLERALVGKGLAKGGARAAVGSTVSEIAGEELEEVLPQVATNYQAGQFDNRPWSRDVGRTAVETAIASGPTSAVSGAMAGANKEQDSKGNPSPEKAPPQLGYTPDPLIVFPDGTVGRRADVEAYIAGLPEEQRLAARAKMLGYGEPADGEWTTAPGAAGPGRMGDAGARGPQEPDLETAPGAAPERGNGMDFVREVDTGNMALVDPEEEARARAATIDYEPADTTPAWETAPGAAPDRGLALEMPAAQIDTSGLALQELTGAGNVSGVPPSQAKTWPQLVAERGLNIRKLRRGTPIWDQLQQEWAAIRTARAGSNPEGTGAIGAPAQEIQNRDRSRPASVVQMQGMAQNPDYLRLGVSRSPESGAPMVFAVGDQDTAAQALGRADVAVMSDGQRVPFRYAVMEAADVQPSNFADGAVNPLFDAAHPGTVKALNNGRTAGLRAAYERGTADAYRQELAADSAMHGIDPAVIEGMQAPVLVRLYSEKDNQVNMGAKSQSQALGLSATEQAATDAALVDGGVLEVFDSGALDSAANRDFARAFIGKLQEQGQDVAGMMDANGALSPAGVTRLQAALVHKAYGDGDLVESLFGSTDNDIRAIGESLKSVAGEWANMRLAAERGAINAEVDVTENLLQAIRLVQKARRERAALHDAVQQVDMLTGDVPDALTVGMLRLLYSGHYLTRPVGRDRLVASLRDYMGSALATSSSGDMFGEQVGPAAILAALSGQPSTQQTNGTSIDTQQTSSPQGGRESVGSDPAGDRVDAAGPEARRPESGGAGARAAETGGRGQGQDAQVAGQQSNSQGAQGNAEEGAGEVARNGLRQATTFSEARAAEVAPVF